mgnify:CR=1 FL=1
MSESSNNSIIDISLHHLTNDATDDEIQLKLQFIEFFRDNTPCIGILPVTGDLLPTGGGKVW